MDADFSHNPNDLPKLFDAAQKGDMSIGSRSPAPTPSWTSAWRWGCISG
jgi:hypothetical protein